jgi:hypothetical protein
MENITENNTSHYRQIYQAAQDFLSATGIPGWLVYDYRGANPVF